MLSAVRTRSRLRAATLAGLLALLPVAATNVAMAEGNPTTPTSSDFDSYWPPEKCADASEEFRFRFYYNSDFGAWVNIGRSIYDLAALSEGGTGSSQVLILCEKGNGDGKRAANNSASTYNWYRDYCSVVYYKSGYKGLADPVYPNSGGNLYHTYNNNKSIKFSSC
ncbi:hypothetical protein [Streptomyces sp. NBC_00094]|uniref:hypothetical protein n=1 Tax=Streptomyces sp. NBC_00094 TaxID=2903620 RepID=UPI002253FBB3|nr:hypothetical protein [Streptomyces sp. NBC_00094]MCX5388487.1 hypothetical protein [Streptomyces sp. NBC_00094]